MNEETIEKIEAVLKDTSHSSMRAKAQAIYDAVFEWRDIKTVPYDTSVLMMHESGDVIQDFVHDCDYPALKADGFLWWAYVPENTKLK